MSKFLQEIKATNWYMMFEYGNVMLNAMTLNFFLKASDAERRDNIPSEWSSEQAQLLHQVIATAKRNL
jgi:hypothetical protein